MWHPLLGTGLLALGLSVGLCVSSVYAETTVDTSMKDAVSLTLEQLPDLQCNGAADTDEFQVPPGACVIYRITLVNNGDQVAHNVVVSADVPEFTYLHTPLQTVSAGSGVQVDIQPLPAQQPAGSALVKATLEQLPPGAGQQVILSYSVRIL